MGQLGGCWRTRFDVGDVDLEVISVYHLTLSHEILSIREIGAEPMRRWIAFDSIHFGLSQVDSNINFPSISGRLFRVLRRFYHKSAYQSHRNS